MRQSQFLIAWPACVIMSVLSPGTSQIAATSYFKTRKGPTCNVNSSGVDIFSGKLLVLFAKSGCG